MDTRTSLLDSAEAALRQRGYSGFSYADLARDIGIRKASIHHHFPTKDVLGQALIERYSNHFAEQLSKIAHSASNAADRLRAYISLYKDALKDGEAVCLCVSMSAGRDHLSNNILAHLEAFHTTSIDWLAQTFTLASQDQTIAHVSDPQAEAHATLALVEGAQLLARASKSVLLFDQSMAAFSARLNPNKPN